jgi:hypothetical protein
MRKRPLAAGSKNTRSTARSWDYCNMLGAAAIALGVAVILGIIFAARLNAPASQQLP